MVSFQVLYQNDWKVAKIWKTCLLFYNNNINYDIKWFKINKIIGKVTKFGEKRTRTLGVANRIMVGGHNVPPYNKFINYLGFIGLNNIEYSGGWRKIDYVSPPPFCIWMLKNKAQIARENHHPPPPPPPQKLPGSLSGRKERRRALPVRK